MLDHAAIATLIPAEELKSAIQLAFRTLVAILSDKKAPVRERRAAATTILRLTSPGREPRVNRPSTPPPPDQPQTPPSPLSGCGGDHKGEGGGEGSVPSTSPNRPDPVPLIPLNHAPTHSASATEKEERRRRRLRRRSHEDSLAFASENKLR